MILELVCGADFWCNRHCRTSPVVLEGCWGQVWPNLGRKPENSEFRIANEPLRLAPYSPARSSPETAGDGGTTRIDRRSTPPGRPRTLARRQRDPEVVCQVDFGRPIQTLLKTY
jgi:hypothetical protein